MTIPVLEGHGSWTRLSIAISGSGGLIGSSLVAALEQSGNDVRRLVRRESRSSSEISWDPERGTIDRARLEGVDAVIHLAGENLAQRWTADVKRQIRDSRVKGTTLLAQTLMSLAAKPRVLLSGSAIGVYGNRGDEVLDERSALGTDFLAEVCTAWEASAAIAADAGIRVVALRTGVVLSGRAGALPRMALPFRLGVGGRLGSGRQWMSWISLGDYRSAVMTLLRDATISGPVNLVAPTPVTNRELTKTLGRVLGRPSVFVAPKFALTLALGQMAEDTVLASQRVRPRRLLEAGFEFREPTLEAGLRAALAR